MLYSMAGVIGYHPGVNLKRSSKPKNSV